jgi:hypothetical protein
MYVLFFWAVAIIQTIHKLWCTLTGKPPLSAVIQVNTWRERDRYKERERERERSQIQYIHVGNWVRYCIFTHTTYYILFFTKRCIFHTVIFFCSNNTQVSHNQLQYQFSKVEFKKVPHLILTTTTNTTTISNTNKRSWKCVSILTSHLMMRVQRQSKWCVHHIHLKEWTMFTIIMA